MTCGPALADIQELLQIVVVSASAEEEIVAAAMHHVHLQRVWLAIQEMPRRMMDVHLLQCELLIILFEPDVATSAFLHALKLVVIRSGLVFEHGVRTKSNARWSHVVFVIECSMFKSDIDR